MDPKQNFGAILIDRLLAVGLGGPYYWPALISFRLETLAWELSLGNFRLEITINNVKNMRGAVEGWCEDFLGNPIGSVFGIGMGPLVPWFQGLGPGPSQAS